MKTGSEKGWNSLQTYFKRSGQTNEGDEERSEKEGNYDERRDDHNEDMMRHDIGDLLGQQWQGSEFGKEVEGEEESPWSKNQKSHVKTDEGPLISFFDDEPNERPVSVPVVNVRTSRTGTTTSLSSGTGYGINSANIKDDWSEDWGDWTGGGVVNTSGPTTKDESGWDDNWNTEEWSSVDLSKTD